MVEKRRDDKGRVLRQGEFQRPDGSYEYKYTDLTGKRCSIYSWKLVETDRTPAGKRNKEALRDMEKQILKDMDEGILNAKTTLNECFERHMKTRKDLRNTTFSNKIRNYNNHIKNEIGTLPIANITYSKLKNFFISLIYDKNLSRGTILIIKSLINPVFESAKKDRIIRENYLPDIMKELKGAMVRYDKKKGLTEEETAAFLDFLKKDKHCKFWSPLVTFLLGTGCRIGEAGGLRWEDVDFENNVININHTLEYYLDSSERLEKKTIHAPKTHSGTRIIPMLSDVKKALYAQKKLCERYGFCNETVDGYKNFIFRTRRTNKAITAHSIIVVFKYMAQKYNKVEIERAKEKNRNPILLPKYMSPHILRHTFCTRFCENETNLKVIQEIMGHSNIQITMNVYNDATEEKKTDAFKNLQGKMRIL